jgi:hypothetical protein
MSADPPVREPLEPFDPARFRPAPLGGRDHLVAAGRFARPTEPSDPTSAFLRALPDFLGVRSLRGLAGAIREAAASGRLVAFGLGGHVLKVGLGPLLVDLARRGRIGAFVLNGAAAIHDAEIAMGGATSEDVGGGLFDGTYGSSDETGRLFAEAARLGAASEPGLGAALGALLLKGKPRYAEASVLCEARRLGLPVTVHVALGTDTVHMHPACDGATLGAATHRDFLRLTALVERMDRGVYVNVGSAVLLPEVFLKAVAMVHNARAAEGETQRLRITTGNLDMLRHYRPRVNVLERPAERGFDVAGHHEIVLPLLRLLVLDDGAEA